MPSNQRLDPLGIYGTRSAARQQAARRRRRWQQIVLLVGGAAACIALLALLRHPPSPSLAVDWNRKLPLRPASAPALTSQGTLLVPSASGQLCLVPAEPASPGSSPSLVAGTSVYASASPLQSAPLISGELAFLPGQDGSLAAVNWRSQKVLWQHASSGALTASPVTVAVPAFAAVPARQIVVGANDAGEIFALDAASGVPVWNTNLAAPVGGGITKAIVGLPTGEHVPVIVIPVGTGLAARGGLVCLDARDGGVRWKFPPDGRVFATALGAPALQVGPDGLARRIYFGTDDGVVYALDPVTGRYLASPGRSQLGWRTPVAPVQDAPAGRLVSLRGAAAWLPKLNQVVVGGNDGGIRALDGDSGRLLWTFEGQGPVLTKARPADLGGQSAVLVADGGGFAYALSPSDGRMWRKWKLKGASPAIWMDVVSDGREVLLLDSEANLQGIRL